MPRVTFDDPDRLITIPDLIVEDVTPAAVAEHVRPYVARREPKWHVEMDLFRENGIVRLRKRDIVIKVRRG